MAVSYSDVEQILADKASVDRVKRRNSIQKIEPRIDEQLKNGVFSIDAVGELTKEQKEVIQEVYEPLGWLIRFDLVKNSSDRYRSNDTIVFTPIIRS